MIGERVPLWLQRERELDRVAKWQEANWDRVLEYKRRWRLAHPEQNAECQRLYAKQNKSKIAAKNKRWKIANRARVAKKARELRARNVEKARAYKRNYYAGNREQLIAKQKAWRISHNEHCRARARAYNFRNKEKKRTQSLASYHRNRANRLAQTKRWRESPQGCLKTSEWAKRSYREKPHYRLRCILCVRMHKVLKRVGSRKAHHTFDLVGTTPELLKQHIEAQFAPGMTWENVGEWHIDHKRPCASFDLTDEAQQRACFHYSNLQPLWRLDNIRKSDKIFA